MKPHTKIYMLHFGYKVPEDVFCEMPNCNSYCIDIHHIAPRSKFGTKTKDQQDDIKNLVALCRNHHDDAHNNILTKEYLTEVHLQNC